MKISKRQLRRIIKEEKSRLLKEDFHMAPIEVVLHPDQAAEAVLESTQPETELIVEMEMAKRGLGTVVESINNAASLCPGCVHEVAAAAPLIEAMVAQAEALQETMDAVGTLVTESVDELDDRGKI